MRKQTRRGAAASLRLCEGKNGNMGNGERNPEIPHYPHPPIPICASPMLRCSVPQVLRCSVVQKHRCATKRSANPATGRAGAPERLNHFQMLVFQLDEHPSPRPPCHSVAAPPKRAAIVFGSWGLVFYAVGHTATKLVRPLHSADGFPLDTASDTNGTPSP